MDYLNYKIQDELVNKTIRDILLGFHVGKEKIYKLRLEKSFFVNDINVDENYICHENDILKIIIKEDIDVAPIPSTLDIIYEDDNYLFVNKPRNILIHSDGVSKELTLTNMVSFYYKSHHIHRKVRFCNRLDYETEGIVAFAKNFVSEDYLNYLIASRQVIKKYYALCFNRFSKKEGIINLPIGRNRHENKMNVSKNAKEAISEYKVLENGKKSLVDVAIHTGRTHQIRVHFAYINHPLVGDNLYGEKSQNTPLCLQAYLFSFYEIFNKREISVKIDLSKMIKNEMGEKNGYK